ncbi:hypothetical protein [Mesorhizobium sp. WSM4884]|uniref:hypothetical protein n=1 Tax=Mesorhizobium sp. WSM4884 TaxID=3038542 RepID=UPI0024166D97|nr:hypothetical protein [Mesorhizobium sp. WSM4884]MDG4885341.1 hypothetical protein [Mesorhizobium sp. WSM4884]
MSSEGIDIFNAVVPAMALTPFADDKGLSDQLAREFAIRKQIRLMGNEPSDNFSTPADPIKNRQDSESVRMLAEAKIDSIDLREEAVDAANKLLIAAINFVVQSANLNPQQAFDLLLGKAA